MWKYALRSALAVCLVCLAGVVSAGCPGEALYTDDSYQVQRGVSNGDFGGQAGQLHPAVIEYVFASPDAPWGYYYDAVGADDKGAEEVRASGSRGIGVARAWARRLTKDINRGLAMTEGDQDGAVVISCCQSMDRDTGKVDAKHGRYPIGAKLIVNPPAKVVVLRWYDYRALRRLTWDLSRVPNAFNPTGTLSYEMVVTTIRPMHGRQPRYY